MLHPHWLIITLCTVVYGTLYTASSPRTDAFKHFEDTHCFIDPTTGTMLPRTSAPSLVPNPIINQQRSAFLAALIAREKLRTKLPTQSSNTYDLVALIGSYLIIPPLSLLITQEGHVREYNGIIEQIAPLDSDPKQIAPLAELIPCQICTNIHSTYNQKNDTLWLEFMGKHKDPTVPSSSYQLLVFNLHRKCRQAKTVRYLASLYKTNHAKHMPLPNPSATIPTAPWNTYNHETPIIITNAVQKTNSNQVTSNLQITVIDSVQDIASNTIGQLLQNTRDPVLITPQPPTTHSTVHDTTSCCAIS